MPEASVSVIYNFSVADDVFLNLLLTFQWRQRFAFSVIFSHHLCRCDNVFVSVNLSACLLMYMPAILAVCLFVWVLLWMSVCLSNWLSECLFVCPWLSVCLSVCVWHKTLQITWVCDLDLILNAVLLRLSSEIFMTVGDWFVLYDSSQLTTSNCQSCVPL